MSGFEALLALQELDARLAQLYHRRAHLPEKKALDDLHARLAAHEQKVAPTVAERNRLNAVQAELEDSISTLDAEIEHVKKQLYSGVTTSPRELQALEADIKSLKSRESELEDRELEILMQREPIDASLAESDRVRAAMDGEAQQLLASMAEATVDIDREVKELTDARGQRCADVEPELLARYEKIRTSNNGVGAARLEHGTCGSCRLKLSAVELDRIRQLASDIMVSCDECGAILVR